MITTIEQHLDEMHEFEELDAVRKSLASHRRRIQNAKREDFRNRAQEGDSCRITNGNYNGWMKGLTCKVITIPRAKRSPVLVEVQDGSRNNQWARRFHIAAWALELI